MLQISHPFYDWPTYIVHQVYQIICSIVSVKTYATLILGSIESTGYRNGAPNWDTYLGSYPN